MSAMDSPSDDRCPLCGGDGWSVRGNEIHCHVCGGTGEVKRLLPARPQLLSRLWFRVTFAYLRQSAIRAFDRAAKAER